MYTVLVIIDVLLAAALIALILLQHGKGADAGAAFGSGSSSTVFGAAGSASAMQKITTWVAAGFFIVTLALSYVLKERVGTAATQASRPASVVQQAVPVEDDTPLKPVPAGEGGVDMIPSDDSPEEIAPVIIDEEVPFFSPPDKVTPDAIPIPAE